MAFVDSLQPGFCDHSPSTRAQLDAPIGAKREGEKEPKQPKSYTYRRVSRAHFQDPHVCGRG